MPVNCFVFHNYSCMLKTYMLQNALKQAVATYIIILYSPVIVNIFLEEKTHLLFYFYYLLGNHIPNFSMNVSSVMISTPKDFAFVFFELVELMSLFTR